MTDNENTPDIFDLDPNALDAAWLDQSKLYFRHAEQLADARESCERAKSRKDVAEDELERIEAEVSLAVCRSKPTDHGLEKFTEDSIKALVVTDAKVILGQEKVYKATARIIELRHDCDVLESYVKALDHRKESLQDLVRLRLANYFSDPKLLDKDRRDKEKLDADEAFGGRKRR